MHGRKIAWVIVLVLSLGFLDAVFLTANHFANAIPTCISGSGCEQVLSSSYSTVGPIPVALLGAVYYGIAILLGIAFIDSGKRLFLKLMACLSIAGLSASVYLVYLQLGPLQSICFYCMISAACSVIYASLCSWQLIFATPSRSKSAI